MHGDSKYYLVRSYSDRVALIAFAIVIWAIGGWMFWIVETFANGNTWWDFCAKLVLHDLVFAIMVFGCALVAHACCPATTGQFVEKTAAKLSIVLFAIVMLVITTIVFVSLVLPLLLHFGIIK